MPSFGDASNTETPVSPTAAFHVSATEPLDPVSNDVWMNPVERTIQVFTGIAWEDFYGPASNADSLVWDAGSGRWTPSAPAVVSPDDTEFVIAVSDDGDLSATVL